MRAVGTHHARDAACAAIRHHAAPKEIDTKYFANRQFAAETNREPGFRKKVVVSLGRNWWPQMAAASQRSFARVVLHGGITITKPRRDENRGESGGTERTFAKRPFKSF